MIRTQIKNTRSCQSTLPKVGVSNRKREGKVTLLLISFLISRNNSKIKKDLDNRRNSIDEIFKRIIDEIESRVILFLPGKIANYDNNEIKYIGRLAVKYGVGIVMEYGNNNEFGTYVSYDPNYGWSDKRITQLFSVSSVSQTEVCLFIDEVKKKQSNIG